MFNKKKVYKGSSIQGSKDEKECNIKKVRKGLKIFIYCILVIVGIIYTNAFFNTFYLVSPIKIQNPIRRRDTSYPRLINQEEIDKIVQKEINSIDNSKITEEDSEITLLEPLETLEKETGKIKGKASYYSLDGCLGCNPEAIMANGDKLDDTKFTLALTPTIVKEYKLLNKIVKVKNVNTGKVANAMVTDTGGFAKYNRVADLSLATKNFIGCSDLCEVEITY